MTSSADWKPETVDYFKKQGRINLATGLMGLEMMQERADDQTQRLKAESQMWHEAMTGEPMPTDEDDDMRQTILGDQITYQTSNEPKKSGGLLKTAAILGASALGFGGLGTVGGLLIADMLDKGDTVINQTTGEDETADLKLGRAEDYE